MVGGGGVRLAPESAVVKGDYFLALVARHDDRAIAKESLARVASEIEESWLEEIFPGEIHRERGVLYDAMRERVVGRASVSYRDLTLRADDHASIDPELATIALAEAARPLAVELFRENDAAVNLLARLAMLREKMPEHPWPAFDAASLGNVLADACRGKRGLGELRALPLARLLQDQLHWPLDRLFEEHAPEAIEVPTGNRIALTYAIGQAPVLAVRLQEIFGWLDTPRIAGGRVPVLLHLLGPNYRPVQITDDLRSFWSMTYFQVRKDLRVKYPKHSWPEDPLSAVPVARGRPRK